MTKAIEAVARAIFAQRYKSPEYVFGEYLPGTDFCRSEAQAALAALKANGYAVVPVEFVESVSLAEMYLRTGVDTCERCGHETATADLDAAYELRDACAMIAAATPHDDGGE